MLIRYAPEKLHFDSVPAFPVTNHIHQLLQPTSTPLNLMEENHLSLGTRQAIQSTPCFISNLPPELLAEVFLKCIEEGPDFILTLGRVCHDWRHITHSFSNVWHEVHLRCPIGVTDLPRSRLKTSHWLEMSKTIPLDLHFTYNKSQCILPLISYALPAVSRWKVATLEGKSSIAVVPGFKDDEKPSRLEVLHVTVDTGDDLDFLADADDSVSESDHKLHIIEFNESTQRLYSLSMNVERLPPPEHMMHLQSLTELSITHTNPEEYRLSPHGALSLLTVCPSLQIFRFDSGLLRDPVPFADCSDMQVVTLPHLRHLSIRSLISIRCFLSHICTPRLEELLLLYLNSSTEYDIVNPGDPGDSEDEAHDPSQSPWTDHATGMGLRKLLSRCRPPLRVLDMDYADMRTKDFQWMFGVLDTLEELRIVASDMSDKVARALMPTENWRPLPRLRRFELYRCQKLSGIAILGMVDSRVRGGQEGLVAVLQEMHIRLCAGFSASNYHSILRTFRPRTGLFYEPYSAD